MKFNNAERLAEVLKGNREAAMSKKEIKEILKKMRDREPPTEEQQLQLEAKTDAILEMIRAKNAQE